MTAAPTVVSSQVDDNPDRSSHAVRKVATINGRRYTPYRSEKLDPSNITLTSIDNKYHHERSRNYEEYETKFSPDLESFRSRFGVIGNIKVLDSGAGCGKAMSQLLEKEKSIVKCTCISKHYFEAIGAVLSEHRDRMEWFYGFAEEVLPKLTERYHVITDLFGAYAYSAKRAELIEEYYNHLEVGGRAFIWLQDHDYMLNFIEFDAYSERLENYLVRVFPDQFKYINNRQCLVLIKTSDKKIHLNLKITRVIRTVLDHCKNLAATASVRVELDYSYPQKVYYRKETEE